MVFVSMDENPYQTLCYKEFIGKVMGPEREYRSEDHTRCFSLCRPGTHIDFIHRMVFLWDFSPFLCLSGLIVIIFPDLPKLPQLKE